MSARCSAGSPGRSPPGFWRSSPSSGIILLLGTTPAAAGRQRCSIACCRSASSRRRTSSERRGRRALVAGPGLARRLDAAWFFTAIAPRLARRPLLKGPMSRSDALAAPRPSVLARARPSFDRRGPVRHALHTRLDPGHHRGVHRLDHSSGSSRSSTWSSRASSGGSSSFEAKLPGSCAPASAPRWRCGLAGAKLMGHAPRTADLPTDAGLMGPPASSRRDLDGPRLIYLRVRQCCSTTQRRLRPQSVQGRTW